MDHIFTYVGIRRENKSVWERRAPLTPDDASYVMQQHSNIKIIVQPSKLRIFSDDQYRNAGCIVSDDLSSCRLIIGVKEIPVQYLYPNKTYMYFSHTIKAQKANLPALDHIIANNIRLIDYEKIIDEKGNRLIAFGRYAGLAGAILFLSQLGTNLLNRGYSTPFMNISSPHKYIDLDQAFAQLRSVGKLIQEQELPHDICPFIIAVTGTSGRCGKGTLEVLNQLPIKYIDPDQLNSLLDDKDNPIHRNIIYITNIQNKHLVKHEENKEFTSKEYYEHPGKFIPIFHDKYLPFVSAIIHNIFWDHRFPRMITNAHIKHLKNNDNLRLLAIGDITCDIDGSIQFLQKYTTPDDPTFYYDPLNELWSYKQPPVNEFNNYISYQAVDFLPSELSYDASLHFSGILKYYVNDIVNSDQNLPLENQGLPKHLERAVMTTQKKLTPGFEYINNLRKLNEELEKKTHFHPEKVIKPAKSKKSFEAIYLKGHLFDTHAINKIFDYLQEENMDFNIGNMQFGKTTQSETEATMNIFSEDTDILKKVSAKIHEIANENQIKISIE